MKSLKFYLKFLPLIVAFAVITASCNKGNPEKEEIVDELQAQDVTFTTCVQSKVKSATLESSVVDVTFTNEGVQITYSDFAVTCDFSEVNVTHTFVNGFLNITQKGTPNEADCVCYTDVAYTIKGITQTEVNVIFINGVQVYCHNGNDESDLESIDGTYTGRVFGNVMPPMPPFEVIITFRNGRYNLNVIYPGPSYGTYTINNGKIIFEDKSIDYWEPWILNGEYEYTFDGTNLEFSNGTFKYILVKLNGEVSYCNQEVIICADEYENALKDILSLLF